MVSTYKKLPTTVLELSQCLPVFWRSKPQCGAWKPRENIFIIPSKRFIILLNTTSVLQMYGHPLLDAEIVTWHYILLKTFIFTISMVHPYVHAPSLGNIQELDRALSNLINLKLSLLIATPLKQMTFIKRSLPTQTILWYSFLIILVK